MTISEEGLTSAERLLHISNDLISGKKLKKQDIAERFNINSRTVQRDMEKLSRQDFDISHKKGIGYFLNTPLKGGNPLAVKPVEYLSFFLANQALSAYKNTDLYPTLLSLFAKLQSKIEKYNPCNIDGNWVKQKIGFISEPQPVFQKGIWAKLVDALHLNNHLLITYVRGGDQSPSKQKISPLKLCHYRGQWYLAALNKNSAMRKYSLSRIKKAEILDTVFSPTTAEIKAGDAEFENTMGILTGNKEESFTIKFSDEVAHIILERDWHKNQKVTKHKDGSVTLQFKSKNSFDVKRWVMSYHKHAMLAKPLWLKKVIKEDFEASSNNYL